MSYATLSCQTVIRACERADDVARLRVEIASKIPNNDRAAAERDLNRIRALGKLAQLSRDQGNMDMQVSVADFELFMVDQQP